MAFIISCSPKVHVRTANQSDVQILNRSGEPQPKIGPSLNPLSYVEHPELTRMKYIRVNFHFMNSTDGSYNMPEEDIATYAREWIFALNDNLSKNMKMFLPHGNNTPALPIPYRYVISPDPSVPGDDGVYYHINDTLCYVVKEGRARNISDKRVIKRYAIRDDSVLNIFVITHHLDSLKSKTYNSSSSGISLGSSVKMFGKWHLKPSVWDVRGITNHEIGHSLGLAHTWLGYDGCDDTPPNPNCWNVKDTPPCDSLLSNNMMDYNAHMAALTPCQIGKILMNMTRPGAIQRNILEQRWCHLDTNATIVIADSMRWNGNMDLEGNLILASNSTLEINCRVSLPEGASIEVNPGAKLVLLSDAKLHNSCGDLWEGVKLITSKNISGSLFMMEGAVIENVAEPLRIDP